jgi:hypothetical protein
MDEVEEDTLGKGFTESLESGGGRKLRSPVVAVERERERERRRKKEKEEEERGVGRIGIGGRASTSLAFYCVKRVLARLASFWSIWCDPPLESSWILRASPSLALFYAPRRQDG